MGARASTLGVVLAGGENRRYGAHKALARVGGERIIDRAVAALGEACGDVVVVANDLERYASLGLRVRPDARPGLGSLGGIYSAVRWAEEEDREAALCAACDMPFLSAGLLRELVRRAARGAVIVPASAGPRGLEPLCAAYGVGTRPAIEAALERGERAVVSFFPAVEVRVLDRETVARFGDPGRLFLNVNTPAERAAAEQRLAGDVPTEGTP